MGITHAGNFSNADTVKNDKFNTNYDYSFKGYSENTSRDRNMF
jgi:hypothetical protein